MVVYKRPNRGRGTVKVSDEALVNAMKKRRSLLARNNRYGFKTVKRNDTPAPELRPREELVAAGKIDSQYTKHMTHSTDMGLFCSLVGDHVSGLLYDRANCPNNPWPTKPETVISYLHYKCLPKGTPLKYEGEIVHDPGTGVQIFCTGSWKCHTNVDAFKGMFKKYSTLYQNDLFDQGTYTPVCSNCKSSRRGWCVKHSKNPRIMPTGDVTEEPTVKAEIKRLIKHLRDTHARRGNYAITPNEMRLLRQHLLSSRDPENFKLYVMMLCGIKLYLRVNELLSLTVEQFCAKMFQLNPSGVRTLSLFINGKCDAQDVLLNIYSDSGDSDLDLVMHLMVYLKSTGITSGLIFPHTTSTTDTNAEIPYEMFLKRMKHLLINVLEKDEKEICVGTHTLRKAAYLFGVYSMLYAFSGITKNKIGK
jgi:hypothetical protein